MKFKIILIIIILAILGGAFYWFQWRPSQIRKECYDRIPDFKKEYGTYEKDYKQCLIEHGLEK